MTNANRSKAASLAALVGMIVCAAFLLVAGVQARQAGLQAPHSLALGLAKVNRAPDALGTATGTSVACTTNGIQGRVCWTSPDAVYSYPTTDVHFLFGGLDTSSAVPQGLLFANQIKTQKEIGCIADASHDITEVLDGANQIISDLQNYCKVP